MRAEGHTANRQLRQDLDISFRNDLEKIKELEIRQEFIQHIEEESILFKSEILDQTVRIIKNCDDSCEGIKEEYQKELTVFAQRSDKNLTGISNAHINNGATTGCKVTEVNCAAIDNEDTQ